jgi:DNA-binding response OmpR family regulator
MRQTRPALLILDIMLPSVNGFDILRRVRESSEISEIPVLVLTAKGQESDRVRMQELGANGFMTKPFSNRDLVAQVRKLTGRLVEGA